MTRHSIFSRAVVLIFLSFFYSFGLKAQQYDSLLSILESRYPQEKLYIHYDRPYYNPGETIWFKAYLVAGSMPSAISSTMYAELLDEKGNVLLQKVVPVIGATASSAFDVPDNLTSSVMYLRAFTSWMLNFDTSFVYHRAIRIIRPTPAGAKDKPAISVNSIKFFPEGGDLIAGLPSRVAFKATNNHGLPVTVKGDIVDSKNQKVASLNDQHDGMGQFSFTPVAGEKYKAVWKNKAGTEEVPLPEIKTDGVTLTVTNKKGAAQFTIRRSENAPKNFQTLQVVAQTQQQPAYTARINMTVKKEVSAPIPLQDLADGILQVTLFSEDGIPLAERIIFVNNESSSFITDLHAVEKNLTKRAKNVLQIDVGDTMATTLSIAVTDAGTTSVNETPSTIFSELLLTSDIKGYVHRPTYYFLNNEDSTRANLDLVMMTNGWRRFKWDEIIAGKWPQIKFSPAQYIGLNGKVMGFRDSELTGKELSVILKTKADQPQIMIVPVDKQGNFQVDNLFFYDTAKLYYQFNNDKGRSMTMRGSFDFRPQKPLYALKVLPTYLNTDLAMTADSSTQKKNLLLAQRKKADFTEGQKVKTLEAVKVQGRTKSAKEKMDDEYTSGFFKGGDGYTFLTSEDISANGSMTVLDYLRGKVAGLQINGSGTNVTLSWRGSAPAVFLNEMNIDINTIQSTSMTDVAMIKVFRPPFFGAFGGGAGGAIAVYTKRGADANSSVKGLDFVNVSGYSDIKQFYSPDYSLEEDKNKNDFRTTLYWNPYIVFDKKTRRIVLPFYNNDNCTRIRVVIEGINEEGKLTREEKIFE